MDYLKRELVSHTRRVCSLYKKMSRDTQFWSLDFFEVRLKKLMIRAEFDKNKNIKDMRVATAMLVNAEKKFHADMHPYNKKRLIQIHPFSKESISYGRHLESPDYVMDFYHPLLKAQYPYYFAKREEMKDEYIRLWKKKMMTPSEVEKLADK